MYFNSTAIFKRSLLFPMTLLSPKRFSSYVLALISSHIYRWYHFYLRYWMTFSICYVLLQIISLLRQLNAVVTSNSSLFWLTLTLSNFYSLFLLSWMIVFSVIAVENCFAPKAFKSWKFYFWFANPMDILFFRALLYNHILYLIFFRVIGCNIKKPLLTIPFTR